MTEQTQPTDAELLAFATEEQFLLFCDPDEFTDIARSVLAKWGTSAGAGEPAGRVVSANCQYATVEWLQQTSEVGGGDPDNSRSWPITGDAVYLTPQPTQAQAGAVPLPKFLALKFHARRDKKATVTLLFQDHEAADAWVRGIRHKGADHG